MKYFLFLLIFFIPYAVKSQRIIQGKVVDLKNNSLFAVNVYLKHNTSIGCVSDFDGHYKIVIDTNSVQRIDTIVFSYMGFKTQYHATFNKDTLNVILLKNNNLINNITIIGEKQISHEFAVNILGKIDIYLNPTSSDDPLKAVTSSSGSTNTEETANLTLRGSNFDRSTVFFNSVPIFNPVRNSQINGTGFFSIFNTELIKEEHIYYSNPPLTYGNSTAGLITLESINKLITSEFKFSLGLGGLGFFSSTKLNNKSFLQWYGNLRQFKLLSLVNKKSFENINDINSFDQGLNYRIQLFENTSLNIYNYFAVEKYNVNIPLYATNVDAIANSKRNFTILNLRQIFKKGVFKINYLLDVENSKYSQGNLVVNRSKIFSYASLTHKHYFDKRIQIENGLIYNNHQITNIDSIPVYYYAIDGKYPNYFNNEKTILNNFEYYFYVKYIQSKKLSIGLGYRFGISSNSLISSNSFQCNTYYSLNKENKFIFSIGYYNAYTKNTPFLNQNSFQSAIDYKTSIPTIKSVFNVGLFYKREGSSQNIIELFNKKTYKDIYGLDFNYSQKILKNFIVNLNYTYLNPIESVDGIKFFSQNKLNYFIKANIQYNHPKLFTVSLDFVARNGLRYTPIVDSKLNTKINVYEPIFSNKINSEIYKEYNSMTLLLSKYISTKKNTYVFYASLSNIFNSLNERGFYYNNNYSSKTSVYYGQRLFYIGTTISFK